MYGGGQRSLQSSKQRSLSTGDLKSTQRTGEQQTKIVNESIVKVETHYPQLVNDFNTYIVRTAKLRDAGDNLHKTFIRYAQEESPVLKGKVECISSHLALSSTACRLTNHTEIVYRNRPSYREHLEKQPIPEGNPIV